MQKILVIEDSFEVRENLEETLELYGYTVITAADGDEGVKVALAESPDLILCDVMMPKLDGFGVLKILSQRTETVRIPFIFLTAKSEKEDFRRGMDLGADDYITKPFYKDDLLQAVETRLEKSARLQQQFEPNKEGWGAFINEAKGYEELKKLSKNYESRQLKRKEVLFEEGSLPRYLYLVETGKLKLYKTSDYGKELIIDRRGAGDFVGYSALIKEEVFNFSAAALEATTVGLIPRENFVKLMFSNKDVASRLVRMLADNLAERETQLLQQAYHSVRKRVAESVLKLHRDAQREGKEDFHILRDDLARMVGTATESVIRMLTEFRDDGYIIVKGGAIQVVEPAKLEGMPG